MRSTIIVAALFAAFAAAAPAVDVEARQEVSIVRHFLSHSPLYFILTLLPGQDRPRSVLQRRRRRRRTSRDPGQLQSQHPVQVRQPRQSRPSQPRPRRRHVRQLPDF
jgi:hypothetical protein